MRRLFSRTLLPLLLSCLVIAPTWAKFEDSPKHTVDEVWQIVHRDFVDGKFNKHDWLQVRQSYLDKTYTKPEDAYKGVRAMLKELNDPYTRFMDPRQFNRMKEQTSGDYAGVGIQVIPDPKTKELLVVSPIPDTPAAKAGIMAKDIIETVDGFATKVLGYEDAIGKIKGKPGTSVTIVIRRETKKFPLTLERQVITVASVRTELKEEQGKKIGYIALREFTAKAPKEMRTAVSSFLDQNVDGFVLDLRNNPGGLLGASTEIASIFLDKKLVVSTVNRTGTVEELETNGNRLTDKPLVLLVNGGSASASEILSGAFQDYHRAALIGTTTFGKGLVQAVRELSDGSGMTVTIAHYKTPAGRDIHKKGITPDYPVEIPEKLLKTLTAKDIATPKDPQYAEGIAVLLKQIVPTVGVEASLPTTPTP
jgi:carboxyl-terminal processing protease